MTSRALALWGIGGIAVGATLIVSGIYFDLAGVPGLGFACAMGGVLLFCGIFQK
jgi:hypothetical protein